MSLCLSADAQPVLDAAVPPHEGIVGRFRRLFASSAEAEGELMPAPTRADVLRMAPVRAAASRDAINALLL